MTSPLIRKLQSIAPLASEECEVLAALMARRVRQAGAREDLMREGDPPGVMRVVLEGWACRFKQLEDGRRQIVAVVLPGDACDLEWRLLPFADHDLGTITPVTFAEVPPDALDVVERTHPRALEALRRGALLDAAVQREWMLSLGQRSAFERLAHLFCELLMRLRPLGLTRGDACDFPLTQADLAEVTGLSAVYVNRTLQELRGEGLIVLKGRDLQVPRLGALMRAAQFDPTYLRGLRGGMQGGQDISTHA